MYQTLINIVFFARAVSDTISKKQALITCKLGDAVQVFHLRRETELEKVQTERVDAVDGFGHIFPVVNVRCFRVKNLQKAENALKRSGNPMAGKASLQCIGAKPSALPWKPVKCTYI